MSLLSRLSRPKITVTIEQPDIFIYPSYPAETGDPDDDTLIEENPILRGTVLIQLPNDRQVDNIQVVLEGQQDIKAGEAYPYESSTTLRQVSQLKIDSNLEAGQYLYNFQFSIPARTASYQKCRFGRVRHYVKAQANFAKVGFTTGITSMTSMTSTVYSPPVEVWIMSTTSPVHDLPESLNYRIEHFSEDLGPMSFSLNSPHLTVSALLYLQILFASPPRDLTITKVQTTIEQIYQIHYKDGRSTPLVVTAPSVVCALSPVTESKANLQSTGMALASYEPDTVPLKKLGQGEEWQYNKMLRIPNENQVRQSTLPGSEASIRISTLIHAEVFYLSPNNEEHTLKMTRPVVLATCCAMSDSLVLPAYSSSDPKTIIKPASNRCYCHMTNKEMFDRDGELLESAGQLGIFGDTRVLILGGAAEETFDLTQIEQESILPPIRRASSSSGAVPLALSQSLSQSPTGSNSPAHHERGRSAGRDKTGTSYRYRSVSREDSTDNNTLGSILSRAKKTSGTASRAASRAASKVGSRTPSRVPSRSGSIENLKEEDNFPPKYDECN